MLIQSVTLRKITRMKRNPWLNLRLTMKVFVISTTNSEAVFCQHCAGESSYQTSREYIRFTCGPAGTTWAGWSPGRDPGTTWAGSLDVRARTSENHDEAKAKREGTAAGGLPEPRRPPPFPPGLPGTPQKPPDASPPRWGCLDGPSRSEDSYRDCALGQANSGVYFNWPRARQGAYFAIGFGFLGEALRGSSENRV